MTEEVFITRLSNFFPNDPVSNDEMEDFLGLIDNETSKGKGLVLRNNKIKNRYYAIDKEGNITHTNAELTLEAIKKLLDSSFSLDDLELLACGTTSPDQLLPSHATMVHGLLKTKPLEIVSTGGSCNAGMHAMKYSFMSIKSGNSQNAVCTGSERLSVMMHSNNFNYEAKRLKELEKNPVIAFEKDFLRWMLSDGAGAALLQNEPNSNDISLRIDWIEMKSFANELETCMYFGAEKQSDGSLKGWLDHDSSEWLEKSLFAMKQDVKLLSSNLVEKGGDYLSEVLNKRGFDVNEIDYFLPHISSEYFRSKVEKITKKIGRHIPQEKWFTNLVDVGNVGSASVFLMLEELFNSGKLKKGEKVFLMVPESARFSYSYALLTVV